MIRTRQVLGSREGALSAHPGTTNRGRVRSLETAMTHARCIRFGLVFLAFVANSVSAAVLFDNDFPNDAIGMASRPSSAGKIEIEAADDFAFSTPTRLTGATFTGLIPLTASAGDIGHVRVEIYRIFPDDSKNPPSGNVPTRDNSPSDNALLERNSGTDLSFTTNPGLKNQALNSVVDGINKQPNQTTGGEGKVLGQQIQFTTDFTTPIDLAAGHYFFVPQVELANGNFLWLSGPRPALPAFPTPINGKPVTDLQAWIRNEDLAPDWLRVGQDIVGGDARFNGAFSLAGAPVPEPSTIVLLIAGLVAVGTWSQRRRS